MAYFTAALALPEQPPKATVDSILQMYVQALGGEAAIAAIHTREIHGTMHGSAAPMRVTCYWQGPDKAAEIRTSLFEKPVQMGFDGAEMWVINQHAKHSRKKPNREMREELEVTTNPLRYVRMKTLYPTLQLAPSEDLESKAMDVLAAPNDNGVTKFYFDTYSHLLVYIKETGITSTYYPRIIRLREYNKVDGIEFPFRIAFTAAEPDATTQEIRISSLKQNVQIDPARFKRPVK